MASCPKLAQGDVVRITRVDQCGAPICGENNAFIDDCWATLQMTANVNEGTDITFTAASGRSCGFSPACPEFLGYNITWTFFSASPELIEMLTGNPMVFDWQGNPAGWQDKQVTCREGFAMEIWQQVVGEECPEEQTQAEGIWAYWLLPWVRNAILGDLTIGNEGLQFSLTGITKDASRWGDGPWDVVAQDADNTAGPLITPVESDAHRYFTLTTVPPPEAECEYVPVVCDESPTSPAS